MTVICWKPDISIISDVFPWPNTCDFKFEQHKNYCRLWSLLVDLFFILDFYSYDDFSYPSKMYPFPNKTNISSPSQNN